MEIKELNVTSGEARPLSADVTPEGARYVSDYADFSPRHEVPRTVEVQSGELAATTPVGKDSYMSAVPHEGEGRLTAIPAGAQVNRNFDIVEEPSPVLDYITQEKLDDALNSIRAQAAPRFVLVGPKQEVMTPYEVLVRSRAFDSEQIHALATAFGFDTAPTPREEVITEVDNRW